MIFFKPWVGKVIFAQTTGGLCVITPKIKSTISFEETLERFNKKKSKELIVNDLQHEITVVKQEIIELKNEFESIKSDNINLKQELLLLKIDQNLDQNQSDNEQDKHKDGDKFCQ